MDVENQVAALKEDILRRLPRYENEINILQRLIAELQRASADARLAIAGGFIRDLAVRLMPNDLDVIVTGVDDDALVKILEKFGSVELNKSSMVYHLKAYGAQMEIGVFPAHYGINSPRTIEECIGAFDANIHAIGIEVKPEGLGEFINPREGLEGLVKSELDINADVDLPVGRRALVIARALRFAVTNGLILTDNSIEYIHRYARTLRISPEMGERELGRIERPAHREQFHELWKMHVEPFRDVEAERKIPISPQEYEMLYQRLKDCGAGQDLGEGIRVESVKVLNVDDLYFGIGGGLFEEGSYLRLRNKNGKTEITLKRSPPQVGEDITVRTEINEPVSNDAYRDIIQSPHKITSYRSEPTRMAQRILERKFTDLEPILQIQNSERLIVTLSKGESKVEVCIDHPCFINPYTRNTIGEDYEIEIESVGGSDIKPFIAPLSTILEGSGIYDLANRPQIEPKVSRGLSLLKSARADA